MGLAITSGFTTGLLFILAVPVLVGSLTILLSDRNFSSGYFNSSLGGNAVLFQHLSGSLLVVLLLIVLWASLEFICLLDPLGL